MTGQGDSSDTGATTARLVERARLGQQSAFGALFARHFPFLERYARRRMPRWLRALSDTQDFAQVAMMRGFGGLGRFESRGRGALRAYLRQIVDNAVKDEFRKVRRRGSWEPLEDVYLDAQSSPHDQAVENDKQRRYAAALSRLDADDRRLLIGRLDQCFSFEQLAFVTSRPTADAARMALKRALKRLAEEMARDEIQPPS